MWNHPNRVFGLDVIRAIAITCVVVSHCTFILPEFNTQTTNAIRLLGATGVDIFFVLSGYLIGGIILKYLQNGKTTRKDLFHFWKRRWLRTLPNYFVVLCINTLLIFILNGSTKWEYWTYFLFAQNLFNPHPDFFTEAWSLSIEEYAYLILPALIYVAINRFNKHDLFKIYFWTTGIVILLLFLFKTYFYFNIEVNSYKEWSANFRKVVIYRLDAIYYGFILVYLYNKYYQIRTYRNILCLVGLVLFVVLHALIIHYEILPQNNQLFYSVFYLPLISLSIALTFPWFINLRPWRLLSNITTYISKRSYAIYLVNYSIVLLTFQHYFGPSVWHMVLFLIFTLALSELLYRLIEQPCMTYRDDKFPKI